MYPGLNDLPIKLRKIGNTGVECNVKQLPEMAAATKYQVRK